MLLISFMRVVAFFCLCLYLARVLIHQIGCSYTYYYFCYYGRATEIKRAAIWDVWDDDDDGLDWGECDERLIKSRIRFAGNSLYAALWNALPFYFRLEIINAVFLKLADYSLFCESQRGGSRPSFIHSCIIGIACKLLQLLWNYKTWFGNRYDIACANRNIYRLILLSVTNETTKYIVSVMTTVLLIEFVSIF